MQLFAAANQQMMLRSLVHFEASSTRPRQPHFEASIYAVKDI
jgi:hypothetical protein